MNRRKVAAVFLALFLFVFALSLSVNLHEANAAECNCVCFYDQGVPQWGIWFAPRCIGTAGCPQCSIP